MDITDAALQRYAATIPKGYVPTYGFVIRGGNDTPEQLWGYRMHPEQQKQWLNQGYQAPEGYQIAPTEANLDAGTWPDAMRLDKNNVDPAYAKDYAIWSNFLNIMQGRNDDFKGIVANLFGNSFTFPAAIASGMMGANLSAGLAATGATVPGTTIPVGTALNYARTFVPAVVNLAQNPSFGSVGSLLGRVAGAYTGVPGLGTVGGLAGGAIDRANYEAQPDMRGQVSLDRPQIPPAQLQALYNTLLALSRQQRPVNG